jgi:Tol biopolymer transport system component
LASILKSEPDWSALSGRCSARTIQLLQRCMEKDAGKRLRDIGDIGIELDELLAGDPTASPSDGATAPRISWLRVGVAGLAGLLIGALLVSGWMLRRPNPLPAEVIRATVMLPAGTLLDSDNRSIALSPDGTAVAYSGRDGKGTSGIWLRRLDSLSSQHLSGTEGATYPFWSPDGNYIGFFADRKLLKIPATGGTAVKICDASDGRGASWGANDLIVFSPGPFGGLSKVAASGGTPTAATEEERPDYSHRNPHFLPDGKRLLFWLGAGSGDGDDDGIYSLEIASGDTSPVLAAYSEGMFVEPGYLAFIRDRILMVQPMDPETLQLSGEPVPLAEDVQFNDFRFTGTFAFARNGLLLYNSAAVQTESQLTWFDLDGNELGKMGEPTLFWLNVDIAPDGRQAIANIRRSDGKSDLWIYDLERGFGSPFTFGEAAALLPQWSPDGSNVAFANGTGQILIKAADGLTQAKTVYDLSSTGFVSDWSPDGTQLLLLNQDRGAELMLVDVDVDVDGDGNGDAKPLPIHSSPADETSGSFSPDGKFLALLSDASGRPELYAYTYPDAGGKWQISTGGATAFQWLPDGSGLIYSTPEQSLVRVVISTSATGLRIGAAEELFGGRYAELGASVWTLAPDGKRLLIAVPLESLTAPTLTLVTNWAEELR